MLKSTHKPIRNYHAALANAGEPIEVAFKHLLEAAAAAWKGQIVVLNTNDFQQNGFITDEYGLSIGTWIHSKTHQEVAVFFAAEIAKEANLLIHQNGEFLHFSKGKLKNGADGHDGIAVVDILELFFNFTPAYFEAWQQVAQYYQTQLPVIERNLLKALPIARKEEVFSRKFKAFLQLFLKLYFCAGFHHFLIIM